MLRENNNLFSYTVQGGRRFFLRKMQVLLQSLKRHVDDDRFICGKGKSVRSRFVQSPRPEMGEIHAFKRPCKSVGDDIRPGKGGENGNGASGRTSERSRTFDDRKKSEVGYHRDIGGERREIEKVEDVSYRMVFPHAGRADDCDFRVGDVTTLQCEMERLRKIVRFLLGDFDESFP